MCKNFFKKLFGKEEEPVVTPNSGSPVVIHSGVTIDDTEPEIDEEDEPEIPVVEPDTENDAENDTVSGDTTDVLPEPIIFKGYKILIDNGHGNDTAGKRSPWSANGVFPNYDFYEYQWNREIAIRVVDGLRKMGVDADRLVCEINDVPLEERVRRVNAICNTYGASRVILISIHANAAGNGKEWMGGRGWSAYTTRGNTKSDELAEYLYREAAKNFSGMKMRVDNSDGDSDQEADFYILKKTYCTAVLTENFFYDNVNDVKYILSDSGKNAVVKTHIDGLINYLKSLQ